MAEDTHGFKAVNDELERLHAEGLNRKHLADYSKRDPSKMDLSPVTPASTEAAQAEAAQAEVACPPCENQDGLYKLTNFKCFGCNGMGHRAAECPS